MRELNHIGKRLVWCREKLGLTQKEVAEGAGIPAASYNGREAGACPRYPEEYLILSNFFSRLWEEKYYHRKFPKFEGEVIKTITIKWIMFGTDEVENNSQRIIEEYRAEILEREREHLNRELELKRQLDLFTSADKL